MGKALFIKGADFSANAIEGYDVTPSFLAMCPIKVGVNWAGSGSNPPGKSDTVNNYYASTEDFCDVSGFTPQSVTINAKSGYKFAIYVGDGINATTLTTWGWNTSITLPNTAEMKKAVIMVSTTYGEINLTSNNIFDYLEEVIA